jgi:peptidoglycan hydrolase-like protein with peptidoglycan-binding domain
MKTNLIIAGTLILLSGCATMEAPPLEEPAVTVPTGSDVTEPVVKTGQAATLETPEGTSPEATAPEMTTVEKPAKKDVQTALKNAGFYAGEIDGKFGPKTKKAVEEFQAANNLKVDGVAGPETWNLLKKYLNLETETKE